MNSSTPEKSHISMNTIIFLSLFWIVSVIFSGIMGFGYGKDSIKNQQKTEPKVLNATTSQIPNEKDKITFPDTFAVDQDVYDKSSDASTEASNKNSKTCPKTGLAQKWEYLTPYVLKANDSLQSIAKDVLQDESRVNELIQLNGVGPFVVGATVYLPPSFITKSSGKIQQAYGKLVEKNEKAWHISFTVDKNGQGILIPSFLFDTVSNKDAFQIGDCVSVLLDDGYKVYKLSTQE